MTDPRLVNGEVADAEPGRPRCYTATACDQTTASCNLLIEVTDGAKPSETGDRLRGARARQ
jgi:hypothetical protein